MDEQFTERALKMFKIANDEARRLKEKAVKSEHLLYALLQTGPNVATMVLNKAGEKIRSELSNVSSGAQSENCDVTPDWDPACKRILERAACEARNLGHKHVGTEHVFLALVGDQTDKVKDVLKKAGVEASHLRDAVISHITPAAGDVQIKIKQREDCKDLPLPAYMSKFASGMDLYAAVPSDVVLEPGKIMLVPTGISIAVPQGYEAQVRPRSGLALKHGLTIVNSPGTIDSDYRGEVGVILANMGGAPFVIQRGMRIAQMVIQSVVQAKLIATDSLDETARHDGGFGHTGV